MGLLGVSEPLACERQVRGHVLFPAKESQTKKEMGDNANPFPLSVPVRSSARAS